MNYITESKQLHSQSTSITNTIKMGLGGSIMNANKTSSEDEMAERHFPLTYLAICVPTHSHINNCHKNHNKNSAIASV